MTGSSSRNGASRWPHPGGIRIVQDASRRDDTETLRLDEVIEALRQAGARAVIVVPLLSDEDDAIFVVRMVAPPLCLNPRH